MILALNLLKCIYGNLILKDFLTHILNLMKKKFKKEWIVLAEGQTGDLFFFRRLFDRGFLWL